MLAAAFASWLARPDSGSHPYTFDSVSICYLPPISESLCFGQYVAGEAVTRAATHDGVALYTCKAWADWPAVR